MLGSPHFSDSTPNLILPPAFGPSWNDFIAEWCLGGPPVTSEAESTAALSALSRLLPEYVAALVSQPTRGLGVIAWAIDLGAVLAACERMPGFANLLPRVQQGDRSAFSEAHYTAALARIGCNPELEPASGTGLLDTAVDWNGMRIYSEVISPERADAIVAAQQDIQALAIALRDAVTGSTVEVLLEADLTPEIQAAVLRAVHDLPFDEVTTIQSVGTMIRRVASFPLQVGPTLRHDGETPIVAAAAGRVEAGIGTAGVVRMPITDGRARRLLAAELHHFSRDAHNILAIDITKVTVGPKNWAPMIRRSFQPGQNRRIGAVIFFSKGLVGSPLAVRQAWAVIPNPYAYLPVPSDFLERIAGLDESAYFRGTPPEATAVEPDAQ
jgi:hypothetical protein